MIRGIFNSKTKSIPSIILVLLLNTGNAGAVICLHLELNSVNQPKVSQTPLALNCQPSLADTCSELTTTEPRQFGQPGEDSECVDLSVARFDLACLSEQDDRQSPTLVENELFSGNSFANVTLPERKQLYLNNPPSLNADPLKVLRSVILII
jgi:hypothetical protein